MKLLSEWGFTREGWRNGQRGEYWVLAQGFLLIGFLLLPVYHLSGLSIDSLGLSRWIVAAILGLTAIAFLVKGLLDLGGQLTPLPYPKENGQLVRSGLYSLVRHPIYSGIIFAALGWTVFQVSLSHLVGFAVLFAFLDAKASREEAWLVEKYPDYLEYRQQVKKLIPWLY